MRFCTLLTYLALLPLSACTKGCNDYDNNEEFFRAQLPAYTETGANTLGCVLGPQTWTVLGKHYQNRIGYPWEPNILMGEGGYSVPPYISLTGQMTGVRDSKPFYDMSLTLSFPLNDSLMGPQLLETGQISAQNLLTYDEQYASQNRHPVRLLVRKLDRQQRIISGTFAGTLYQTGGPDSLAVTDGRFDVKY